MARFCGHCGRPLADGETCNCTGKKPVVNVEAAKGFMETVKNHMGIGDPELNKGDAFEKDKLIIPDCVKPNEGEIPVKQYKVATLRNRIFVIPYSKAIGRVQVTNKRVIFRAPGRCLAGRTTLQHEFAIDELAGVEARREYTFNFVDLFFGLVVAFAGAFCMTWLLGEMCASGLQKGEPALAIILNLLLGGACCAPFVLLKKKWLLKLLCLGGALMPWLSFGSLISDVGKYTDSGLTSFFGGFITFLGIITIIPTLFTLVVYSIKPNLVLLIKTKAANEAIDIKRKKFSLFGKGKDEEHTGYAEVIPADDAEHCIREVNAIISDIQKLGDFGIEKWKK